MPRRGDSSRPSIPRARNTRHPFDPIPLSGSNGAVWARQERPRRKPAPGPLRIHDYRITGIPDYWDYWGRGLLWITGLLWTVATTAARRSSDIGDCPPLHGAYTVRVIADDVFVLKVLRGTTSTPIDYGVPMTNLPSTLADAVTGGQAVFTIGGGASGGTTPPSDGGTTPPSDGGTQAPDGSDAGSSGDVGGGTTPSAAGGVCGAGIAEAMLACAVGLFAGLRRRVGCERAVKGG